MQRNVNKTNSRLVSKLALFCTVISTGFSTPLLAAEMNTYRAGTPYHQIAAQHYQQCESQCQGDAACRSWNFVRPSPNAASGICEFNSRLARPVRSPISMSGNISTAADTLMSRAIAGPSHTIKIGSPARQIRPQVSRKTVKRPATHINRQPIPQRAQAQPTNYKRQLPTQRPFKQAAQGTGQQTAQGMATPVGQMPATNSPRKPSAQQQMQFSKPRPYQNHIANRTNTAPTSQNQPVANPEKLASLRAQKARAFKQKQMEMMATRARTQQQQMQFRALQNGHNLEGQRQLPQNMPIRHNMAPPPQQRPMPRNTAPNNIPPAPMQMPQREAVATYPTTPSLGGKPIMAEQKNAASAQRRPVPSLYGSLHDDLTQGMTAVPRPTTMPDNLANEDSPMATSRARPTIGVKSSPLDQVIATAPQDQSSTLAGQ